MPVPESARAVPLLVRVGTCAVLAGACIVAVLHVVGPGASISPISRTISEYGLTSVAWAFDTAVLAVALGSAAILAAAVLAGATSRTGALFGALWVAGMVVLVAFPKANWAVGPSVSGQVHRAASLVAFIALPLAVTMLLRPGLPGGMPAPGRARGAVTLALAGLAWFVPIIVAIVSAGRGGAWWTMVPLGLVERGMAVTEIAALLLLGGRAARAARNPAGVSGSVAPAAAGDGLPAGPPVTDPAAP